MAPLPHVDTAVFRGRALVLALVYRWLEFSRHTIMEQAAVNSLEKGCTEKTMISPSSLRMVFSSHDPSTDHSHLPVILTSSTDRGIGGSKEQEDSKNGIHRFA